MGCVVIRPKAGGVMIVCSRGKNSVTPCRQCGDFAVALCDWPVGSGKTCDVPLCDEHRHPIGENLDLCPVHHEMYLAAGGRVPVKTERLHLMRKGQIPQT